VRALLNQHFAKPGLIDSELADFYNDLFDTRHETDYGDFVQLGEDDVRPWIARAERFVAAVVVLAEPEGHCPQ
jgi:uncharacterized protein (UPF0332 family)